MESRRENGTFWMNQSCSYPWLSKQWADAWWLGESLKHWSVLVAVFLCTFFVLVLVFFFILQFLVLHYKLQRLKTWKTQLLSHYSFGFALLEVFSDAFYLCICSSLPSHSAFFNCMGVCFSPFTSDHSKLQVSLSLSLSLFFTNMLILILKY